MGGQARSSEWVQAPKAGRGARTVPARGYLSASSTHELRTCSRNPRACSGLHCRARTRPGRVEGAEG